MLDFVLGWIGRTLWKPVPLAPWPGWNFGDRPRGLRTLGRRAFRKLYTRRGNRKPLVVPWHYKSRLSIDFASQLGFIGYVGAGYEPNEMAFMAAFLHRGMTVVDVGANEGWHTLLAAGSVGPSGRVVAFEPSSRERQNLVRNVQLSELMNVEVRAEAIDELRRTATLHVAERHYAGQNTMGAFASEGVREAASVTVAAADLDSMSEELGLRHVDLIKVDVEGAEGRVLRGARRILDEGRPLLLIELNPLTLESCGDSAEGLLTLLQQHRYTIFPFSPRSGRPTAADVPLSPNVVAVPEERIVDLARAGIIEADGGA